MKYKQVNKINLKGRLNENNLYIKFAKIGKLSAIFLQWISDVTY